MALALIVPAVAYAAVLAERMDERSAAEELQGKAPKIVRGQRYKDSTIHVDKPTVGITHQFAIGHDANAAPLEGHVDIDLEPDNPDAEKIASYKTPPFDTPGPDANKDPGENDHMPRDEDQITEQWRNYVKIKHAQIWHLTDGINMQLHRSGFSNPKAHARIRVAIDNKIDVVRTKLIEFAKRNAMTRERLPTGMDLSKIPKEATAVRELYNRIVNEFVPTEAQLAKAIRTATGAGDLRVPEFTKLASFIRGGPKEITQWDVDVAQERLAGVPQSTRIWQARQKGMSFAEYMALENPGDASVGKPISEWTTTRTHAGSADVQDWRRSGGTFTAEEQAWIDKNTKFGIERGDLTEDRVMRSKLKHTTGVPIEEFERYKNISQQEKERLWQRYAREAQEAMQKHALQEELKGAKTEAERARIRARAAYVEGGETRLRKIQRILRTTPAATSQAARLAAQKAVSGMRTSVANNIENAPRALLEALNPANRVATGGKLGVGVISAILGNMLANQTVGEHGNVYAHDAVAGSLSGLIQDTVIQSASAALAGAGAQNILRAAFAASPAGILGGGIGFVAGGAAQRELMNFMLEKAVDQVTASTVSSAVGGGVGAAAASITTTITVATVDAVLAAAGSSVSLAATMGFEVGWAAGPIGAGIGLLVGSVVGGLMGLIMGLQNQPPPPSDEQIVQEATNQVFADHDLSTESLSKMTGDAGGAKLGGLMSDMYEGQREALQLQGRSTAYGGALNWQRVQGEATAYRNMAYLDMWHVDPVNNPIANVDGLIAWARRHGSDIGRGGQDEWFSAYSMRMAQRERQAFDALETDEQRGAVQVWRQMANQAVAQDNRPLADLWQGWINRILFPPVAPENQLRTTPYD
jgi:hypothetical protein